MNKREVIKLVSERLGAAKNEVKVAFDIFLQKVAEAADENSSIRVPDIGIFHLKKKENSSPNEYNLLFLPLKFNPQEKNKILSFDVKVNKEPELTAGESAFNISIGKPLIPIIGVNRRDFMVQSSYIMLQKTFEERTDKLLSKSVELNDLKIDPRLIANDEEEINNYLDDYGAYESLPDEGPEIPWDFGSPEIIQEENQPQVNEATETVENTETVEETEKAEDVEIEIPADEIPDFKNVQTDEEETIAFDPQIESEPEYKPETLQTDEIFTTHEENPLPEESPVSEEPLFEQPDEDILSELIDLPGQEELTSGATEEITTNDLTDFNPDAEEFRISEEDLGLNEEYLPDTEEAQIQEETFVPEELEELVSESEFYNQEQTEKDSFQSERMNLDIPFEPGKDYVREDEKPNMKVKFGSWFWIILIAFIVLTLGGIYYFLFYNQGGPDNQLVQKTPQKNIIKRDYNVPVTIIPRSDSAESKSDSGEKSEALKTANLNKANENKSSETKPVETKPLQTESEEVKTPVVEKKEAPPVSTTADNKNTLVKDYIFSDGSKYTLQISSWRSRSAAEKEVNRLKESGFPSYMSEFHSKAGQNWYRVRVGEFSSLQQSEDFLNKNVNKLFK